MNNSIFTHEDREWLSRIEDLSDSASTRKVPKFTKFCDERLLFIFNEQVKNTLHSSHMIWGGYEGFERAAIGFFPDYCEPDASMFPFSLIKISGARGCSHRDFLGSLLGLGITRDMIGDILISDKDAYVFIYDTIKSYVMQNLTKIASYNVILTEEDSINSLPQKKFEEIFGTVSSVRLDSVVSLFTKKSRGDSQSLINAERVFVNHSVCKNTSMRPKEGDIISVRGFGKMKLISIGGETKKGRIRITINKYV